MSLPLVFGRSVVEPDPASVDAAFVDEVWEPAPPRSVALAVVFAAGATVAVVVLVDVVLLLTVGTAA